MTNNDSDLPERLAAPARRAVAQAGFIRIEQFTALTEANVRLETLMTASSPTIR